MMFRYNLRTLLIVVALGPMIIAIGYVQFAKRSVWLHRKDGPLIQDARFLGNRSHSDKKLAKVIGVRQGIRLNSYTAEESLQKIKAFYVRQGYRRVQVMLLEGDRRNDKQRVFQIVEGGKSVP